MKYFTALQKPYVYLINLLAPYVRKIDEKWRDIILEVALTTVLFVPFYDKIFYVYAVPKSEAIKPILVCLFLLIAVVFSIRDKVEPVRLSHAPVTFLALDVLALTISFIVKRKDPLSGIKAAYPSWLIIYALLLPMLFIIWTNRGDLNRLYSKLTRAYACIFTVYSWAMVFVGHWVNQSFEPRLTGTADHPNTLAALLFTGLVCCAYHLLTEEFTVLTGIYWLGVAISGFLLMLTGSRTVLLAIVAALLVLLAYTLLKKNRRSAVMLAAVFAVFIVSFCVGRPYYTHQVTQVFSNSVAASADVASRTDTEEYIEQQVEEKLATFEENREGRLSVGGKTFNNLLSNRPNVWKNYLQRLNVFGASTIFRRAQAQMNHEVMATVSHAHNFFLEMAFRYGVIVGSLSLLMAITAVVWLGFCLFDRAPYEKYRVFSILALCEFCITAIPEFYGNPPFTVTYLLYIFALLPVFCRQKPEADEAEEHRSDDTEQEASAA